MSKTLVKASEFVLSMKKIEKKGFIILVLRGHSRS